MPAKTTIVILGGHHGNKYIGIGQSALPMSYQITDALDQLLRNSGFIHEIGRKNEQRHSQQREAVEAVEHLGEHDGVGNIRHAGDASEGHYAKGE